MKAEKMSKQQPSKGQDTQDRDPTKSIQQMQKSLIRQQGGHTEFAGVADRAKGKSEPNSGDNPNPEHLRGDQHSSQAQGDAHTPGEYQSRNFGSDDNVTPESDYGDFFI